jgi:hypothetical protein
LREVEPITDFEFDLLKKCSSYHHNSHPETKLQRASFRQRL